MPSLRRRNNKDACNFFQEYSKTMVNWSLHCNGSYWFRKSGGCEYGQPRRELAIIIAPVLSADRCTTWNSRERRACLCRYCGGAKGEKI
ncbi:hypothetical protein V6N13_105106 [Hibiscus sabdariffa]|uniref:Uncharacterized protein n=2 Tax=Hibiscus sabdariffa TaxID=183260 RepID=A0ABR1ZEI2_9ROSI